jgi:hypothetical protein
MIGCVYATSEKKAWTLESGESGAWEPCCLAPAVTHPTCSLYVDDINTQRIDSSDSSAESFLRLARREDLEYKPVPLSLYLGYRTKDFSHADPQLNPPTEIELLQPYLIPRLAGGERCPNYSDPKTPPSMARVYADVNANMPRSYWDYDSVNISWGAVENYEVVRKIGMLLSCSVEAFMFYSSLTCISQAVENTARCSKASTLSTTRNVSSKFLNRSRRRR